MEEPSNASFEESHPSMGRRLATFLTSVLPADPAQLLFLAGTIFLLITPRLPWQPLKLLPPSDRLFPRSRLDFYEVYSYVVIGNLITLAAGIFALYTCLWPVRQTLRKLVLYVIVPSLLGQVLILREFYHAIAGESSILDTGNRTKEVLQWIHANIWNFPTGTYFLVFGVVLIGAYCLRMATNSGALPITQAHGEVIDANDNDYWRRARWVLFVWIGLMGILSGLPQLIAGAVARPYPHTGLVFRDYVYHLIAMFLGALLSLGISMFLLGSRGLNAARASLRSVNLPPVALSFCLPVAIYGAIPFVQYVLDHIYWAAHDYGRLSPPILTTYFDLRLVTEPWVVFLVFLAFVEEIVFRGVLLDEFVRRHGLHRGIFLTGLAWAAIHFRSDSYSNQGVGDVLETLGTRILFCLALNYVFAWMFLRWRSVIPPGIAHTVWNMLVMGRVGPSSWWSLLGEYALWVVLAFVLYRFWPIVDTEGGVAAEVLS